MEEKKGYRCIHCKDKGYIILPARRTKEGRSKRVDCFHCNKNQETKQEDGGNPSFFL